MSDSIVIETIEFSRESGRANTLTVWAQEIAVEETLRLGGHYLKVHGPGLLRVRWELFTEKRVRITKLSTAVRSLRIEQTFTHALRGIDSVKVELKGEVFYRLIERREEVEIALKRNFGGQQLSVHDKINKFADLFALFVHESIERVVQNTPLVALQHAQGSIGPRVKQAIESDGRARVQLAIAIVDVNLSCNFAMPPSPQPPGPELPFVIYDGPAELAPNCRLINRGKLDDEPVIELDVDHVAVYRNVQGRLTLYPSGQLPLDAQHIADPRTRLLIISNAPSKLVVPVETRILIFSQETEDQRELSIKTTVELYYQIIPEIFYEKGLSILRYLMDMVQKELSAVCQAVVAGATEYELRTNRAELTQRLRDELRHRQPFQNNGILIVNAWFTSFDLPPWFGLDRLTNALVYKAQLQHLYNNQGMVQVDSNRLILFRSGGVVRGLEGGVPHQPKLLGQPTTEVRVINLEHRQLAFEHTAKPLLPFDLVRDMLPAEIRVSGIVEYWIDSRGERYADLWDLQQNEERLREKLGVHLKSALNEGMRHDPVAFLRKDTRAIEFSTTERLQERVDDGLHIRVIVEQLDHADEIWEALSAQRKGEVQLIEMVYQIRAEAIRLINMADAQAEAERRLPPVSLQTLQGPDAKDVRLFLNDLIRAVRDIGERNGSTAEVVRLVEQVMSTLHQLSPTVTVSEPRLLIDGVTTVNNSSVTVAGSRPSNPPQLCARFEHIPPGQPLNIGSPTLFIVWVGAHSERFRSVSTSFHYKLDQESEPIEFDVSVKSDDPLITVRPVEPILIVTPTGQTTQEAEFLVRAIGPVEATLHVTITRKLDNALIQHLWVEIDAADPSTQEPPNGNLTEASQRTDNEPVQTTPTLAAPSLQANFTASTGAADTTQAVSLARSLRHSMVSSGLPVNDKGIRLRPVRIEIHGSRQDNGYKFSVEADLPNRRMVSLDYPVPLSRNLLNAVTRGVRTALTELLGYVDRHATGNPTPFRDPSTFIIDSALARRKYIAVARAGQDLWQAIFATGQENQRLRELGNLLQSITPGTQLQVAIKSSDFIIPWALIYDGPTPITEENLTWSGFWGYRYLLDVMLPNEYPGTSIEYPGLIPLQMLLNDHDLRSLSEAQLDSLSIELQRMRPSSKYGTAAMTALSTAFESPLVYAFCHGEDPVAKSVPEALPRHASLIFGLDAMIRLADLPLRVEPIRPLIFLNACCSAATEPLYADGFASFFINQRGARAFIGTETEIPQALAHDAALRFWRAFDQGESIAKILYDLRRYYLDQHNNILAFAYSLYGPGDVHLAQD